VNNEQIEYLKNKIVQMATHIEKQTQAKKDLTKAYGIEIKDTQKRLNIYAKAVSCDAIEPLHDIMGEFELAEFEKIGK